MTARAAPAPRLVADAAAWAAFVRARGQPLLDLYAFESSENYHGATKAAWTAALPWYARFGGAPALRAAAKARTAHLAIAGLDLDALDAGREDGAADGALQAAPAGSLLAQQRRLREFLRRPDYGDSFRLYALVDQFCGPLVELMGEKTWLLTDREPSTVDFVALGYLMVMLRADMPKKWLANAIETKYPKLIHYLDRLEEKLAGQLKTTSFETAARPTFWHGMTYIANSMLKSIPMFGIVDISRSSESERALERYSQSKSIFERYRILRYATITFSALGITALGALGYMQWHSRRDDDFIIRSGPSYGSNLADFGDAGEFLAVFGDQLALRSATAGQENARHAQSEFVKAEALDRDQQRATVVETVREVD